MAIARHRHRILLGAALACWLGCEASPADGEGSLRVTIYGEAFIEDEIPAAEVVDGWTIRFDKFLVTVDGITADGKLLPGALVFDLTRPSNGAGHDVGTITMPAGAVEHLDYRIGPASSAAAGNATPADVDRMTSQGHSLYAEGSATRGGETVAFGWGFDTDTSYVGCETDQVVTDGGETTTEITIHADHLFYDDLDLPEPNVAFDLIASGDADEDGEVTADELRAVDITAEASYGVGSRNITELWSFVAAQTSTVGHIDGEGHCEAG